MNFAQKGQAKKEIEDIDAKLLAAGISNYHNSRGILASVFAILFSVILAIILVYFFYGLGDVKPTSNIQINYEVGEMVEEFLLGSDALIAGVAYAISTLIYVSELW